MDPTPDPAPEARQLREAGDEREARLGQMVEAHRRRLLKMVHVRLDPRLKARLGASDVIQDVFVDVVRRVDEFVDGPDMPFFLWLRLLTAQKVVDLHRKHLHAKKRDVRRQADGRISGHPDATSVALVDHLMDPRTRPSVAAVREEARQRAIHVLDTMKTDDREILVLRHFEELTNAEAAVELGISEPAASKRYVRALARMGSVLGDLAPDASR